MNDLLLQADSGMRATTNSFVSAWESVFGKYNLIYTRYLDNDGVYHYMEGIDYGYIARVVFFIVVVYCILKMIGGIFKHGKS